MDGLIDKRFSIFGSCVSRDVFGFTKHSASVAAYVARSTVCSAVSRPLSPAFDIQSVDIKSVASQSLSPFELRMVRTDVEKTWWDVLHNDGSPALIVDLIDERFSVIELGGGRITESAPLVRTAGYAALLQMPIRKLDFLERDQVDRESMVLFSDRVRALEKLVYLHRAFWAMDYESDGERFRFEKHEYHRKMNEALKWRYDYLQALLPEVVAVEVPETLRIADSSHRWGLAPFHYVSDYYENVKKAFHL